MPNPLAHRITSLRKLIDEGLYITNLDKVVSESNALSQDCSEVLFFFVLKNIFRELSDAMDGYPVSAVSHAELTQEIASRAIRLLNTVENGERVSFEELQQFAALHLRNLNIFRSS